MVFPDGIMYDYKNDRVQTTRVNNLWAVLPTLSTGYGNKKTGSSEFSQAKSGLVTSSGFKPETS